jgi:EAL domain-containing protein (putative c-di-GMP-specific phosphodiesterase class I)
VGVVEFDQTVKLSWLGGAWHLDNLQQLEARLRARGRPGVTITPTQVSAALQAGQLELRYQPTLNLRNAGATSAVEGLLRWNHPTLGLLTAGEFLPVASDSALLRQLTDFALLAAVQQLQQWRRVGIATPISINLDVSLLNDVQFPKRLAGLIREYGVDPGHLRLEVSEHGFMSGSAETGSVIEGLFERDFHLSLDDFGSAAIALQHVLLLPFAEVKLSADLIHGLAGNERARRLTRGLIHLVHDLGMHACGKGVETAEQMLLLQAIGCDAAQGWYIGGPVLPAALPHTLSADPVSVA